MEINTSEEDSSERRRAILATIRDVDVPDWSYNMRREMQEIVEGLYLGPYSVAVKSRVFFHTINIFFCD